MSIIHFKRALLFATFFSTYAFAQTHQHESSHPMSPAECPEMMVWDYKSGNCTPLAMAGMPMRMYMLHGNAFLVQNFNGGDRGTNHFSSPNMVMGDIGTSLGDINYINFNFMLTLEKWTYPSIGYPQLLQIGEEDKNGNPYIDAQHPHSSPIMGLTLSDTISLGGRDHFKFYFSPRGQATEGPIAFMHRVTGMANPDAPLGHHVGQDVAHISSTVIGASLNLQKSTLEASIFNGEEPEPTKTDLPMGSLNSYAFRFIQEFSDNVYAMASMGYSKDPEHDEPEIDEIYRYSASIYYHKKLNHGWMFHNAFIFGVVNFYDQISKLRSFGNEFLFHAMDLPHSLWGRAEFLERGGAQLLIENENETKWIGALTLGYTYDLYQTDYGKIGVGFSATKNFIPSVFDQAYGVDPLSGKVFVQLSGMKMGNF